MKESQNVTLVNSKVTQEKKNWVSPELESWNATLIENGPGAGPDGVAKTYNA
ncbi:hypothetical protein G9H62_08255 [Aquirufa ecclesiirivi]|uniref:hypothetical protein n=1 Tax=Aquirufa ecclesiirivi TaxID=2715124 RepID=UPI0022A82724|nr:hypothetical protein [Aquirufa ecclesiirivi]MCZ2472828.1 hypothetical protein [Aquirufa ecclesiirivi]